MSDISSLYRHRFNDEERRRKNAVWKVLCEAFFQRYISPSDTVLDLGAGFCEFINHIRCRRKFAVDLSEETSTFANSDVTVVKGNCSDLSFLAEGNADVVFASNFFEHLRSKDELLRVLREANRVLKLGGRFLILQPNIRYLAGKYWDFFDHHLPLTHLSMVEALELCGFEAVEVRPQFLPYTTKSHLPQAPFLVRWYLRLTVAQWLLGKQMFVCACKRRSNG